MRGRGQCWSALIGDGEDWLVGRVADWRCEGCWVGVDGGGRRLGGLRCAGRWFWGCRRHVMVEAFGTVGGDGRLGGLVGNSGCHEWDG